MSSKTPESYSYDEAPAVDWRAQYPFLDDAAERSPVEDWSAGELVQGVASWRRSGLSDWPAADGAERWQEALGDSDYRPDARLHEVAASLAGAYTHGPERLLREYDRALEAAVSDSPDSGPGDVDRDVYWRVDSYGARLEGLMPDGHEVEDGVAYDWSHDLKGDLALARDELELGRRLVYLGVVAGDEGLVEGGRRLADDGMSRFQESVDGRPGYDDLAARASLYSAAASSVDVGATCRVDHVRYVAEEYGPGSGAERGLVDALERLVSDKQAARDVGWAAESFSAAVADGPVAGPVGDLLAAAGRDLSDANLVFRRGYASALSDGRENGVSQHLGEVLDAVAWGGEAAAAAREPSHFSPEGTGSDRVLAGQVADRRFLQERLDTEGEMAVWRMSVDLQQQLSGGSGLPGLVAGYAYSRAEESRVLMSQPGWSEEPESRDAALEGYLQARSLVLLNSDVLARRGG